MDQLEAFYETIPKPSGFIDRKYKIPSHSCNLYGPPRSGKTWLVLDYLHTLEKKRRLYIDLADLRIDKEALITHLPSFLSRHRIQTLVLDHFEGDFSPPLCQQCITITRAPLESDEIPHLAIMPLDFEEYLAFERRHVSLEHSFSLYLRTGALPQMVHEHESLLTMRHHSIIRSLFPDETERLLFKILARFQGKPTTAHQLYIQLKKSKKISKDRLYATLARWEAEGIFQPLPKHTQSQAARKIIFFDFALPSSLYFEKSLLGQLYTLTARRLIQSHTDPVFSDTIDLLLPQEQEAFFISPFTTPQSAATKIATKIDALETESIRHVTLLTIGNRFAFTFEKIAIEAKPIYEWLLQE